MFILIDDPAVLETEPGTHDDPGPWSDIPVDVATLGGVIEANVTLESINSELESLNEFIEVIANANMAQLAALRKINAAVSGEFPAVRKVVIERKFDGEEGWRLFDEYPNVQAARVALHRLTAYDGSPTWRIAYYDLGGIVSAA